MMDLVDKIKTYRLMKNLTQEKMAHFIKVSLPTYCSFENKKSVSGKTKVRIEMFYEENKTSIEATLKLLGK